MRLLRLSVEKTDSMVAFTFVVKKEGKSWHATRVAAETEEEGEAIEASADDTGAADSCCCTLQLLHHDKLELHADCSTYATRQWCLWLIFV